MKGGALIYVLRRIALAVPTLLAVLTLNFAIIHLAPGDPVAILAGDHGDETYMREMRARYLLDDGIAEQYIRYLANIARGDFGRSFANGQPVTGLIGERLTATLLLMGTAQVLAALAGVTLGTIASSQPRSWLRGGLRGFGGLVYAVPSFWIAQLLIWVCAFQLGWFPIFGMETARTGYQGIERLLDIAHHLVLPAIAVALTEVGLVLRITESAVSDVREQDYVRTAHAKGLSRSTVLVRHVLRNALLPVITVIGGRAGTLLTGAVLVEIVFAWPGIGRLLYQATLARDYPLLMALFLVSAVCVLIANLIADIAYSIADPRVRVG